MSESPQTHQQEIEDLKQIRNALNMEYRGNPEIFGEEQPPQFLGQLFDDVIEGFKNQSRNLKNLLGKQQEKFKQSIHTADIMLKRRNQEGSVEEELDQSSDQIRQLENKLNIYRRKQEIFGGKVEDLEEKVRELQTVLSEERRKSISASSARDKNQQIADVESYSVPFPPPAGLFGKLTVDSKKPIMKSLFDKSGSQNLKKSVTSKSSIIHENKSIVEAISESDQIIDILRKEKQSQKKKLEHYNDRVVFLNKKIEALESQLEQHTRLKVENAELASKIQQLEKKLSDYEKDQKINIQPQVSGQTERLLQQKISDLNKQLADKDRRIDELAEQRECLIKRLEDVQNLLQNSFQSIRNSISDKASQDLRRLVTETGKKFELKKADLEAKIVKLNELNKIFAYYLSIFIDFPIKRAEDLGDWFEEARPELEKRKKAGVSYPNYQWIAKGRISLFETNEWIRNHSLK